MATIIGRFDPNKKMSLEDAAVGKVSRTISPKKKISLEEAAVGKVSRTIRDEPPTHFQLRIESFSSLSTDKYYSGNFQAGGYEWKLCLHPKGNKDENGDGHISLYLEMVVTDFLSPGWEVHSLFRLFVFDQHSDNYLTLQDVNERPRRFHATKTQYGFDRFISSEKFKDPKNGYLVKDTCVLGAEVFVHKESIRGKLEHQLMPAKPMSKLEHHLIPAKPVSCIHTWKIQGFSKLDEEFHYSEIFAADGLNWKIKIYPKGLLEYKGKTISLFLELNDSTKVFHGGAVHAAYQLGIVDQVNGKNKEHKGHSWFDDNSNKTWGLRDFLALNGFRDQSNGYLVNDVCIIEAHVELSKASERECVPTQPYNHNTIKD